MQPAGILIILIPIVAIVLGLGTGMLNLFLNYRKRKDMFALYHQERMAAIEKGIELPPLPEDFFHEEPSRRSSHGTLLTGLILVFAGLTLYLALHFTVSRTDAGGDAALYALVPCGIGAACLLFYFIVGRKAAIAMEEERKARLTDAARAKNPPA
jgi:predicted transporter